MTTIHPKFPLKQNTPIIHVDQIVIQNDINSPGQLSGRCILRHLLHTDCLVVLVFTQAVFRLQGIVVLILYNSIFLYICSLVCM